MARLDAFWNVVCAYRESLWLGVLFMTFLLALTLVSLVFAVPGTASRTLAVLNLLLILSTLAVMGGIYWICSRRRTSTY